MFDGEAERAADLGGGAEAGAVGAIESTRRRGRNARAGRGGVCGVPDRYKTIRTFAPSLGVAGGFWVWDGGLFGAAGAQLGVIFWGARCREERAVAAAKVAVGFGNPKWEGAWRVEWECGKVLQSRETAKAAGPYAP